MLKTAIIDLLIHNYADTWTLFFHWLVYMKKKSEMRVVEHQHSRSWICVEPFLCPRAIYRRMDVMKYNVDIISCSLVFVRLVAFFPDIPAVMPELYIDVKCNVMQQANGWHSHARTFTI